jgi:hypothetical protein
MASSPQYAATPKNGTLTTQLTTADSALNNPVTSIVSVFTAGANGSRIDRLKIKATGSTSAGLVRLFVSNDGGTNKRLVSEIAVTAITTSSTVPAFEFDHVFFGGLILQPSAILYATTSVTQTINVIPIIAGDL